MSGVNKKHPYHYTQTGVIIMPLSMIGEGETATITRVGGKEEARRFLENL